MTVPVRTPERPIRRGLQLAGRTPPTPGVRHVRPSACSNLPRRKPGVLAIESVRAARRRPGAESTVSYGISRIGPAAWAATPNRVAQAGGRFEVVRGLTGSRMSGERDDQFYPSENT